jgi:hypothetical protein
MEAGYERIEVDVTGNDGLLHRHEFVGRWLGEPYHDGMWTITVALTEKGRLAVVNRGTDGSTLLDVYDDLADVSLEVVPRDLLEDLAERLEVVLTERLDI